jgi:hypothetical protein
VVIDIADYWHLKGDVPEFKDYLRAGAEGDELDLTRSAERPRNADWADET